MRATATHIEDHRGCMDVRLHIIHRMAMSEIDASELRNRRNPMSLCQGLSVAPNYQECAMPSHVPGMRRYRLPAKGGRA